MAAEKVACVQPAGGPVLQKVEQASPQVDGTNHKEGNRMLARVGKPAPDFELSALINGGFKNIRLSDYKGKWIVVCFYPGDFTFV